MLWVRILDKTYDTLRRTSLYFGQFLAHLGAEELAVKHQFDLFKVFTDDLLVWIGTTSRGKTAIAKLNEASRKPPQMEIA